LEGYFYLVTFLDYLIVTALLYIWSCVHCTSSRVVSVYVTVCTVYSWPCVEWTDGCVYSYRWPCVQCTHGHMYSV